jgi:UDPglucose 6-dehydrogenase
MRIAMIGTGYVGLVSAACFAEFGHDVHAVDVVEERILRLRRGEIPIYEPGLKGLVQEGLRHGTLTFSTDLTAAVASAEVVFLAVGTPSRRGDGHADLRYVEAAAEDVAAHLLPGTVVVMKSTVPVGTAGRIEALMRRVNPDTPFAVASNPEFLREGSALADFRHPDRVIIGVSDAETAAVLRSVYRPLSLREIPIVVTSRESAELAKYAANAFLAMKITFINEIADLCEEVDADVQDVARGLGMDRRIGATFLHPGPGYGGSCFPKDTVALMRTAQLAGVPLRLVETAVAVNDNRKSAMASRIIEACGGSVRGRTIGVLGLTFKPNTDDMRDAPSLTILPALLDAGARIQAFDPVGMPEAARLIDGMRCCNDPYDTADGADAVVVITEWNAFRGLSLPRLRAGMRGDTLVDLRNVYRPADAEAAGFMYHGIGRGSTTAAIP